MIVLKSYATWVTLALAASIVAVFALGDNAIIAEALRIVATVFMLMMMPSYASAAASCYATPGWPEPKQWAGLATFVLAVCAAISGLVSLFYRLSGKPAWILELPIINAWSLGLIIWGAVFTAAPGFFGREVRAKTKISLAMLWVGAIGLVAYLALVRPDLAPLASWIEWRFLRGGCG